MTLQRASPTRSCNGGSHPAARAPHHVRPRVAVWPIQLMNRLPVLPVPLLESDPDVPLDLAAAVASVYERGAYAQQIDYQQPPPPPALSSAEADWLERLRQQRS